jgi:dsRNA-specific ribonuclease
METIDKPSSVEDELYIGPRDESFKTFIKDLLNMANIKDKYIDLLTNKESMIEYGNAFTSDSVDENNNYQVYEQLGDLDANTFIVKYMYRRFPKLKCSKAVKIVARLRINYGSTKTFAEIANKLGFWPFISASRELRDTKMKKLLEDTFESFLGATSFMLDSYTQTGVGSAIVYDILETIFDKMPISLAYEDLYDAKTILKETFDKFGGGQQEAKYLEIKGDDRITRSVVYMGPKASRPILLPSGEYIPNRDWIEIGKGAKAAKADAQQLAAVEGIKYLRKRGWEKPVPELYKTFCDS